MCISARIGLQKDTARVMLCTILLWASNEQYSTVIVYIQYFDLLIVLVFVYYVWDTGIT